MINKQTWIDNSKLENFILHCQYDKGGISDRPGNEVDVFHTFFGIASLSLLDKGKYDLEEIDPIYALPKDVIKKRLKHL